jgi:hypothetical protein
MLDGQNDEPVNATRMHRSQELGHGGSPVVAQDARCSDTESIQNADHIGNHVLEGIGRYAFREIRASETTQVRGDCAEAVWLRQRYAESSHR